MQPKVTPAQIAATGRFHERIAAEFAKRGQIENARAAAAAAERCRATVKTTLENRQC